MLLKKTCENFSWLPADVSHSRNNATTCLIHELKVFRVVKFLLFVLGDSPKSEFYVPTFQNTLFQLYRSREQNDL
jgi:hypothetical protein